METFEVILEKMNHEEMLNYIKLGTTGLYPLFDARWLLEHADYKLALPYHKANRNVRDMFKMLSRHHSTDRKRLVLESMDLDKRREFVSSFLKIVEYSILKNNEQLH